MTNLMKALVKARPEPGIWMEEVPVPEVGPNDVLIRVKKSAICGTDVHIYNWDQWAARTVPVPMVVGHEFVGEIADLGSAVSSQYRLGQRVAGEGHVVCGHCRNCRAGRGHLCRNTLGVGVNRPGSFAEYVAIPQHNVVAIPDDVPDEIAAIFDPLGNAVHTALSFDLVGEDVLVTGAGPIGIMGALVAQCVGARKVVITDINPVRLELARKMGVRHVVDASREKLADVMQAEGMREGFDVGLEMSGSAHAFRDMIAAMNNGGKVAILGIAPTAFEIDWNQVIFKMLTLKGIYGREMFETWYKMIALVQGPLDVSGLITHRIGIDDFQAGFDAMRSGSSGKVVMDW
jgi:threonine 3-dehydrogenase